MIKVDITPALLLLQEIFPFYATPKPDPVTGVPVIGYGSEPGSRSSISPADAAILCRSQVQSSWDLVEANVQPALARYSSLDGGAALSTFLVLAAVVCGADDAVLFSRQHDLLELRKIFALDTAKDVAVALDRRIFMRRRQILYGVLPSAFASRQLAGGINEMAQKALGVLPSDDFLEGLKGTIQATTDSVVRTLKGVEAVSGSLRESFNVIRKQITQ